METSAKRTRRLALVVDDSEEIRESYELALLDAGYDVASASSGVDGFEQARALRPDIVVSDVVMPGLDGLELLTRIRSDLAPPVPPVVLCSGFDVAEEEAMRRGAVAFLRKPVQLDDFVSAVDAALEGHLAAREQADRARKNASAARQRSREAATALLHRIGQSSNIGARLRAANDWLEWLAAFFDVQAAACALFEESVLRVEATGGRAAVPLRTDLSARVPASMGVFETSSSLVVPDASLRPWSVAWRAANAPRFFVGVPLFVAEQVPVGVLCLADDRVRAMEAEELVVLEHFGRAVSTELHLVYDGRADDTPPGRLPSSIPLRPDFWRSLFDAEVRLLARAGGVLDVVVLDPISPASVARVLASLPPRARLAAGRLSRDRVVVFERHRPGAGGAFDALVEALVAAAPGAAAGRVTVAGEIPALTGNDVLRAADLALDQSTLSGGLRRVRLALETESPGASP